MKDPRSKKAIAAGLSLTLALGSVPAVAFADNAAESNDGDAAQQGARVSYNFFANSGEFADGEIMTSIEADEGGWVDLPVATREGYTFKGWYPYSSIDGIPADKLMDLEFKPTAPQAGNWFAAWEKNATQSIEVVSHFVGGDRDGSSETTVVEVPAGSYVSDCVKGELEGYTAHQIVSGVATSAVEVYMTSSLEGITTLHVYYKADKAEEQDEVNVLYVANGGQFLDGNETMQGVADSDGMLRQPPAPTREGYTFAGWYWHADYSNYTDEQKEADKVDFSKPIEKSAPVYAQWIKNQEQNEINVTYVANGGQFADGQEVQQGLTDSEGFMRQPAAPTREGYTFAGWYWHQDLSQYTDEQKEADKVDFTESVAGMDHAAMYAQWTKDAEQNEIDVLYVANGGQFATGETFQQGMTDSEGFMRQPAAPTREGYTFAGWYWVSSLDGLTDEQKDLNKVDFEQSVAGKDHVTMFAQWTKDAEQENLFNVMYVANGGEFFTGETFQQGVTDSEGLMRQPVAPTREGYTFDGWYWHADLSQYTAEQKEADKVDFSKPLDRDGVMYAQWTKDAEQENLFNVMYVANGGEFFTGETFQQGVTDSEGLMRQPVAPTREGYTFDGWYWHADLSQYTAEQKALDKVDFTAPIDRDAVMYAQWSKVVTPAEKKITVKFVDNFNKTESTVEINEGETVAQPKDPSYKGWSFEGWSSTLTDEQGNAKFTPVDFSKVVADEDEDGVVTYYAFYTEDKAETPADTEKKDEPKQETAEENASADEEPAAEAEAAAIPQTGDATNAAAVAGVAGIAGLLAAAAALIRRRFNN